MNISKILTSFELFSKKICFLLFSSPEHAQGELLGSMIVRRPSAVVRRPSSVPILLLTL
jgi:hypothetical protein